MILVVAIPSGRVVLPILIGVVVIIAMLLRETWPRLNADRTV